MKQTRDKIKQYQRRIEQTLEKDRLLAKKLIQNGRKELVSNFFMFKCLFNCLEYIFASFFVFSRALLLLRKKKFQEQLLSKSDGQLENLERMVHDIEFAQVELKVVEGLKVGNVALKTLHNLLSIDEIDKILDETKEGIDKQNEIDEMLLGVLTEEDEGEVEAELDALLIAEIEEKAPDVPEELPEKKKGMLLNRKYYFFV